MALEKDFLRFMLSDGASCALLENHPGEKGVSLKIEWIEMDSYANETPTCMFAGAVRREDGELKSWKSFESQELVDESLMVIKQDIKLLGAKLMPLWIRHIKSCLNKHGMTPDDVDYVIPHSSSMVIYGNLIEAMKTRVLNCTNESGLPILLGWEISDRQRYWLPWMSSVLPVNSNPVKKYCCLSLKADAFLMEQCY